MLGIKDNLMDVKIISPVEEQCFFGYYDLNAYDSTGTKHLCHRVNFIDRIPGERDVAELGLVSEGRFEKIGETTAWNFQQGALLQFQKDSDEIVFYNERVQDAGYKAAGAFDGKASYVTTVHNIKTGEKKHLPRAAACISPNGKYALSINFSRIFGFRAGYGYAGVADAFEDCNRPAEDGIWLMDVETGECRLIIDYERIYREFPVKGLENEKMVVNHITFNESSDRFLFLLRNFPSKSGTGWGTTLITSDLQGNMHLVLENKFVSHYCWKGSSEILAFCTPKEEPGLFVLQDLTNQFTQLKSPYPEGPFGGDIHCLCSPDKRYIIGDGYPDAEGYRPLFLYDTQTEKIQKLLRSLSTADDNWDIRCDLHARFNRQGDKISFDSTHCGMRQICEIALK